MSNGKTVRIQNHFQELRDPRRREVTYPLINVVVIAICAVICGADDFVTIARFGNTRRDWFAKILDLSLGIPSHDRFNRIFAALNPAEFEKCLFTWITILHEITDGQIIKFDDKTLCGSFDVSSNKAANHMVSAWTTRNQITLEQVVVDAKSNEITAIPKLLQVIDISGALVMIDAMGCQTEIAKTMIHREADYCLSVKRNQPTLDQEIELHFETHLESDFVNTPVRRFETMERGHGREENRYDFICPVPDELSYGSRWPQLKAIGMSIRDTIRDGKQMNGVRYEFS